MQHFRTVNFLDNAGMELTSFYYLMFLMCMSMTHGLLLEENASFLLL